MRSSTDSKTFPLPARRGSFPTRKRRTRPSVCSPKIAKHLVICHLDAFSSNANEKLRKLKQFSAVFIVHIWRKSFRQMLALHGLSPFCLETKGCIRTRYWHKNTLYYVICQCFFKFRIVEMAGIGVSSHQYFCSFQLWRETLLTGAVQVSHFLRAELFKNKGEPFRFPHARQAVASLISTAQNENRPKWSGSFWLWRWRESNPRADNVLI